MKLKCITKTIRRFNIFAKIPRIETKYIRSPISKMRIGMIMMFGFLLLSYALGDNKSEEDIDETEEKESLENEEGKEELQEGPSLTENAALTNAGLQDGDPFKQEQGSRDQLQDAEYTQDDLEEGNPYPNRLLQNNDPFVNGMQPGNGPVLDSLRQNNYDPFSNGLQKSDDPFSNGLQQNNDPFSNGLQQNNDPFSNGLQKDSGPFSRGLQQSNDPFANQLLEDKDPFSTGLQQSNDPFGNKLMPDNSIDPFKEKMLVGIDPDNGGAQDSNDSEQDSEDDNEEDDPTRKEEEEEEEEKEVESKEELEQQQQQPVFNKDEAIKEEIQMDNNPFRDDLNVEFERDLQNSNDAFKNLLNQRAQEPQDVLAITKCGIRPLLIPPKRIYFFVSKSIRCYNLEPITVNKCGGICTTESKFVYSGLAYDIHRGSKNCCIMKDLKPMEVSLTCSNKLQVEKTITVAQTCSCNSCN